MGSGKTQILYSSTVTLNSPTLYKVNTRGFGATSIYVRADEVTSGASLTVLVHGYPADIDTPNISNITVPIVASGTATFTSGEEALWVLSDPYDSIGVGVMNTTANKSGRITVIVTRKRRQ